MELGIYILDKSPIILNISLYNFIYIYFCSEFHILYRTGVKVNYLHDVKSGGRDLEYIMGVT